MKRKLPNLRIVLLERFTHLKTAAEVVGVRPETLSRLISGKMKISDRVANRLMRLLDARGRSALSRMLKELKK